MVELNCETDFVARNKQFHVLLNEISDTHLANAPGVGSGDEVAIKETGKEDLLNMVTKDGEIGRQPHCSNLVKFPPLRWLG